LENNINQIFNLNCNIGLPTYTKIIIIAPLTIVEEDQGGDLECLHKACPSAITDGGLFTDTDVDERCENERQGENDCEMKTVAGSRGQRTDKS